MFNELGGENSDIPVIVMSGIHESKDSARLLSGEAACLRKPFGPDEISTAVRRVLDDVQTKDVGGRFAPGETLEREPGAVPERGPDAAPAGGATPPGVGPAAHQASQAEPTEGTR